ncbi:MAG: hypothetical protein M3327_06210 [Actinomycetota bacterium]|nr:hypothetical protein [Actinomycetota bacterium]
MGDSGLSFSMVCRHYSNEVTTRLAMRGVGGVLCICPSEEAQALRSRLGDAAYELRHWDNGTPDPLAETSAADGVHNALGSPRGDEKPVGPSLPCDAGRYPAGRSRRSAGAKSQTGVR